MPDLSKVSISSTAATVVLAAADTNGKSNRLHSIALTTNGANTIQFDDGGTILSGAHTLAAGGIFQLDTSAAAGIFSSADTALNLIITGAGTVSGHAAYVVS